MTNPKRMTIAKEIAHLEAQLAEARQRHGLGTALEAAIRARCSQLRQAIAKGKTFMDEVRP